MLLSQFTSYELKHFREVCNFTDQELEYFNLKAKNNSNIKIASEMSISESLVPKIAKKVKSKIVKVLEYEASN